MADRETGPGPEYPTGSGAGMAREPERSTADILKDALGNVQELIRSEVRLAKAEMREEASKAAKAALQIAAGVVIALYGVGFLFAFVTWLLATAMSAWLASLIVGAVLVIIGSILAAAGRSKMKRVSPVPERTIQSVKEDVAWLKDQTK